MGWLGFLTGDTKTTSKVIDAGISGLDKMFFTDEERAEYNHKLQQLHLQFVKVAASESTAQSISRRLICLPVIYVWLLLIVASVVFDVLGMGPFASIKSAIEQMNVPALAAIGFNVGRHIATGLKK